MKKLIVRADDLGYSEAVNYGIEKAVKQGIINNVGLMVNMPYSQQGVNFLKGTDVCLGCHTNICAGRPLTDPKRIPSITNENGEFKSSNQYRATGEDVVVLDEVLLEIEAQYQRFVELTGRKPEYFEGHAIASLNMNKGLKMIAEKYGLKHLELVSFDQPTMLNDIQIHVTMDAMKPDYDPFASLKRAALAEHTEGYSLFVTHPGYLDAYLLKTSSLTLPRAFEVEMLCHEETKRWLEENDIELITFNDI